VEYNVQHFQSTALLFVQHDWQNVGTYYEELIFDLDKNFTDRYAYVNSEFRCLRNKCTNDQIKVPDTEDKCCWHCVPCNEFDYKVRTGQGLGKPFLFTFIFIFLLIFC
jgi:hypothetical protein